MKTVLQIIVFLSLFLAAADCAYSKDWRGIIPLHSTRQDVEKLLGQPTPPRSDQVYSLTPDYSKYFLNEGEVSIVYAAKSSQNDDVEKCLNKIPEGTVLYIEIRPLKELKLRSLDFNFKNATLFNPTPHNGDTGYKGYFDKEEGMIVSAYEGIIARIVYIAASRDEKLCPDFYQDPESLVRLYLHT